MLKKTDTKIAPWHKIDANNFRKAQIEILKLIETEIAKGMELNSQKSFKRITADVSFNDNYKYEKIPDILSKTDLTKSISREEYNKKLDELQDDIQRLQYQLYKQKTASIFGFEGWDAGGKGGAIKRFTRALYPLGYEVVPTAAPNERENNRHYLWRFWNKIPFDGEITIFDRTWYGKVLVEKIERFATKNEWQRAYDEINNMEYIWACHGMIVNKFWMQIDKDEQYKRFMEREHNPEKNWKITDEDWRNRDKWDAYEDAVNEMLYRTNTEYAPWYVIAGNDKLYARISVLKHIKENMEKKLKK
jgi:polyphosphate kinase 2 (PPK2 family)